MFGRFLLFTVLSSLAACGQSAETQKPPRDPVLYGRGEMAFARRCVTCHHVDSPEHESGPSLVELAGRKAGSLDGFSYSAAMRVSGIVWDADTLDRYLADPERMVPGTTMPLAQVDDPEEREALIHYLLQH